MIRRIATTGLLLVLFPVSAWAAIWYVDAAAPGQGDGSAEAPFISVHDATDVALSGDTIFIGPGIYQATRRIEVYGQLRRTLLNVPPGVHVMGSGREETILQAPETSGPLIFGITSENADRATTVEDLRVAGPCFQGVNLRSASPTLRRIDVMIVQFGTSTTAVDVRDGSDPLCVDLLIDGGHSGLFVEFGSLGRFEDCVIRWHPNEALAFSNADPTLIRCRIEGAGRDLLVLNQGSQPRLVNCILGRGDRWTVRIAGGYSLAGSLDLGGNQWFTTDLDQLEAATLDANDDPSLKIRVNFLPLADTVSTTTRSVSEWKGSWR